MSSAVAVEEKEIVKYAKSIGGKYLIADLSERIMTIGRVFDFFDAVEGFKSQFDFK